MATAVRNTHRHARLSLEAALAHGLARAGRVSLGSATSSGASRPAIARASCCSTTSLAVRDLDRRVEERPNERIGGDAHESAKRVLVVGLGNMGMSHALRLRAHRRVRGRGGLRAQHRASASCRRRSPARRGSRDFDEALAETKPDVVSINTWSDTHADYADPRDGSRRACLRREAARRDRRRRRARGRRGAAHRSASSSSATSCATIRRGCGSSSSRGRWARRSSSA